MDPRRVVPGPLPPALHHPQLEREQLVERQAPEGGIPRLERRRVVRVLDRGSDPDEPLFGEQRSRQVFGVGRAGPIDRDADLRSEPGRGQAGRQPVDRDDPAGVKQRGAIVLLEFGVVEGHGPTATLDPAADHDRIPRLQATVDVTPAEPGRFGLARFVTEVGDRPLDAPPERLLDAKVADVDAGADDGAVLDAVELAQPVQLAQVLVAARQVEQQVADGTDPEPARGCSHRRRAGQAAAFEWRVEDLGRRERRCGNGGAPHHGHRYSAASRYR